MSDRAWIATRKGLFELRRDAAGWRLARAHFLGEPVSIMLPGTAARPMIAALNLGPNRFKAMDDHRAILQCQHPHPCQHPGMRDGTFDILPVHALVELHGSGERCHESIGVLGKSSAPSFVGLRVAHKLFC